MVQVHEKCMRDSGQADTPASHTNSKNSSQEFCSLDLSGRSSCIIFDTKSVPIISVQWLVTLSNTETHTIKLMQCTVNIHTASCQCDFLLMNCMWLLIYYCSNRYMHTYITYVPFFSSLSSILVVLHVQRVLNNLAYCLYIIKEVVLLKKVNKVFIPQRGESFAWQREKRFFIGEKCIAPGGFPSSIII